MASTRLRKTFQYPSEDEGSIGSRDELDEEGQSTTIESQAQLKKIRTRASHSESRRSVCIDKHDLHDRLHTPPTLYDTHIHISPHLQLLDTSSTNPQSAINYELTSQFFHDVLHVLALRH